MTDNKFLSNINKDNEMPNQEVNQKFDKIQGIFNKETLANHLSILKSFSKLFTANVIKSKICTRLREVFVKRHSSLLVI